MVKITQQQYDEIIAEFEEQKKEMVSEYNKQIAVVIKEIADMGNEIWESIINQFYNSYSPNEYERRGEQELMKAGGFEVNGASAFGEFGEPNGIKQYPSISKNEKGADADWVINKMMDGERGSLKGLRHLLGEQIIRKSKYFREQAYEFQVSCKIGKGHSKKIEGTPNEIIDAFIDYAQRYLDKRKREIWNGLLPKYELVEIFIGRVRK